MKRLSYLIAVSLVLTVTVVLFVKCQKNSQKQTNEASDEYFQKTSLQSGVTYKYTCTGSGCTGTSVCSAIWDVEENFFECCDGCYVEVTVEGQTIADPEDAIDEIKQKNTYYGNLSNYIQSKHSVISFNIKSISYGKQGTYHMFMFEYITSTSVLGSVAYLMNESDGQTTRVDCHGSCPGGADDCVEIFTFSNPPTIECKCSGPNCVMDITTLD